MDTHEKHINRLVESSFDSASPNWDEALSESGTSVESKALECLRQVWMISEFNRRLSKPSQVTPCHTQAPEQGTPWGILRILSPIGSGSFASVYKAWDTKLQREVALKLVPASRLSDLGEDQFREGVCLARVAHPNIVTVYGIDQNDGKIGIWMEHVAGSTLEGLLEKRGNFSVHEAVGIGIDLCAALSAVHKSGLVHRDVKTQNVMMEEGGRVVLMDFGISHSSSDADQYQSKAGTPFYMAPELVAGQAATPAADIYSLGVLLFRLVTLHYPIQAMNWNDVVRAHSSRQYKRLVDIRGDLPASFVDVVQRAIQPNARRRFRSMGQMGTALSACLVSSQTHARRREKPLDNTTPWLPVGRAFVRSREGTRPRTLTGVAVGLCSIMIGLFALKAMVRHDGAGFSESIPSGSIQERAGAGESRIRRASDAGKHPSLQVEMNPAEGTRGASDAFFTVGSTREDVLSVQGPPTSWTERELRYGSSSVYLDRNGQVRSWHIFPGSTISAKLLPQSSDARKAEFITIGSSTDDVIAVQGTPTAFDRKVWEYGYSRLFFRDGVVVGWNNHGAGERLIVKLPPGDNRSPEKSWFTVNSTKDDVLAIQGTPTEFSDNVWKYGKSTVFFKNSRVARWEEWPGSELKIRPE